MKPPPEPAYWRVWWLAFCGLIMAGVAVFTAYLAAVHGGSMFGAMAFVASSLGSISHFARMITEIQRL